MICGPGWWHGSCVVNGMKCLLLALVLVPLVFVSCNKPTRGQNTSEYRDGNSGANTQTIEEDTPIDSTGKNGNDEKKE